VSEIEQEVKQHDGTQLQAIHDVLQDPIAVHANMLRGGIAKPSPTNIWHLYGRELFDAMPHEFRQAARERALDEAAEVAFKYPFTDHEHSNPAVCWNAAQEIASQIRKLKEG